MQLPYDLQMGASSSYVEITVIYERSLAKTIKICLLKDKHTESTTDAK